VTVRAIAGGSLGRVSIRRVIFHELRLAALVGIACGLLAGLIAQIWPGNLRFGVVVGIAMFCSIAWASMMGVLLLLTFNRFDLDPAVASGPFIFTMNDAVSLLIYFALVTALLRPVM
jgi:magnesium transporter